MAEEYEVARLSSLPEAELLTALLRRHGIEAWLPDRDMATLFPHLQIALGGIRVVALADQIDRARDLARRARAGEFATPDEFDDWREAATPGKIGELDESEVRGIVGSKALVRWGVGLIFGSSLASLLFGYPLDLREWLP
jgi:hypothetical protein